VGSNYVIYEYLGHYPYIGNVTPRSSFSAAEDIPTFCGTRMFVAMFAWSRHWSLSCARRIQSTPSYLYLGISNHLCFPTKNFVSQHSHARYKYPAHLAFNLNILIFCEGYKLWYSPPSVSRLSRENVGASTSHNPVGLHGLLQGYLYFFYLLFTNYDISFIYIDCVG
jgi:hypothetical protein